MGEQRIRQARMDLGRVNGEIYSDVVSSNKVRVNYLAIRNARARWLQEVVRIVLCCGCRQKLGGLWYYFCTETIGRKCILCHIRTSLGETNKLKKETQMSSKVSINVEIQKQRNEIEIIKNKLSAL